MSHEVFTMPKKGSIMFQKVAIISHKVKII
jgi:hypothetical protein